MTEQDWYTIPLHIKYLGTLYGLFTPITKQMNKNKPPKKKYFKKYIRPVLS